MNTIQENGTLKARAQTLVQELVVEIEHLLARVDSLTSAIDSWSVLYREQVSRTAILIEALTKYGRHLGSCARWDNWGCLRPANDTTACTCGLKAFREVKE